MFDCVCVLQLIEMLGGLLERPLIHRDFKRNYPLLISMYSSELDTAKLIFDEQVARAKGPQGLCGSRAIDSVTV